MRALLIVVGSPGGDLGASVGEIKEQGLVEKFVAHPAIEAFDEAVLHRLSGRNEVPLDAMVAAPGEHRIAGELRAVVAHDHAGFATSLDNGREFARNATP